MFLVVAGNIFCFIFVVCTTIVITNIMKIREVLKITKQLSPFQLAGLNIMYTGNWLTGKMEHILKPHGLSEQQYNVLRILRGQHPKPVNLFEIQDRMISRMSNVTRLVDKLCEKGYVERKQCEDNRRKVEITITGKGLGLLSNLDPILSENHIRTFEKITAEEANTLNRILDKLRS